MYKRQLYHLQRHSDHHAWPARRYQTLRNFPEAPQLPTGYAGMILLAAVPPLWFRVMDRLVLDLRARQARPGAGGGPGIVARKKAPPEAVSFTHLTLPTRDLG